MKPSALAFLGILLASPLALAGLEGLGFDLDPPFTVAGPTWEADHAWTWDVSTRARGTGQVFGLLRVSSDDLKAEAVREARVLNTTQTDAHGERLVTLLESFRLDRVRYGDETLHDGEEARDSPGGTDLGPFFCILSCTTHLVQYQTDGNPHLPGGPQDGVRLFDFPLTRGKTWTVLSAEDDMAPFEIEARAASLEYVDLDGFKPMRAVRIDAKLTEATRDAVKTSARSAAAEGDVDLSLDLDLRFTYWYAPEVQHLVKLDLDGFIGGRVSGLGAAGAGRLDFHLDQVLRDVDLSAGPERSLAEAQALVQEAQAANGDPGPARPDPWPFQVGASASSVDASAGREVRFHLAEAMADDPGNAPPQAPPAGSAITWSHRYHTEDGAVVETHQGSEAAFPMHDPGLHVVGARVTDRSGRLLGTAETVVEVYTHEVRTLEPAADAAAMQQRIDVTDLFIAPGATAGTITVASDALAKGTLHLGDDQAEPLVVGPDPVQVTVDDLVSGVRTIAWTDELRAHPLTVAIDVRYDRDASTGEATEAQDPHPLVALLAAISLTP